MSSVSQTFSCFVITTLYFQSGEPTAGHRRILHGEISEWRIPPLCRLQILLIESCGATETSECSTSIAL